MEEYKCYVCKNNYDEQELARNDRDWETKFSL